MFAAAEFVRDRQARIIQRLRDGAFQFALSGSNATFIWIGSVDESAVRQYRNVELIIDRKDDTQVANDLTNLGLAADIRSDRIVFWHPSIQRERCADMALFAGELLFDRKCVVPALTHIEWISNDPVISLEPLVTFQLSRWLLDDQVDLRDMIEVGLIDANWLPRLPSDLAPRLQELLDNPDG
jgi:hypothetical protein